MRLFSLQSSLYHTFVLYSLSMKVKRKPRARLTNFLVCGHISLLTSTITQVFTLYTYHSSEIADMHKTR